MHLLSGGKPKVHFYRSMSLISRLPYNDTDDDADKSALSGVIDTLRSGTSVWNASNILHSFVVQSENVTSADISNFRNASHSADADNARIYHTFKAH